MYTSQVPFISIEMCMYVHTHKLEIFVSVLPAKLTIQLTMILCILVARYAPMRFKHSLLVS